MCNLGYNIKFIYGSVKIFVEIRENNNLECVYVYI